jgi:sulfoxide reductase heme-binding subunit YedZ
MIYLIAALGELHFWWLVKADIREPVICALLLGLLLVLRLAVVRHSVRTKISRRTPTV